MRFPAVVTLLLAGLTPAFAIGAEPPAALVMDLKGATSPSMAPMSEIPSGTPLKLDAGAELTLLDYARCKMVTVSGGSVTVTRFDFVTDGKIVSEVEAPCPRVHKLAAASGGAVAGGLVMRGVAAPPKWPLNREFTLAGDASDTLKAAAVYADGQLDKPLVTLAVAGRQAKFPADAPALAVNERYVLRLTLADRPQPVDISFIGAAPTGPSLLVVLRNQ